MIQVKLLSENAKTPTRNAPTDAGLDLYASEAILIKGQSWKAVGTSISILCENCPAIWHGLQIWN
jgi:dUTPase